MVQVSNQYTQKGTKKYARKNLRGKFQRRISKRWKKYTQKKGTRQYQRTMYRKKGTFRKKGGFRKKVANTILSLRETKYRDYDTTTFAVKFRNAFGLATLRDVKPIFYITDPADPGSNNYFISQGDGHQDRTGDTVQFRGFRLQTTISPDYSDTNLTVSQGQYVQKRIRRMVIAIRILEGVQQLAHTYSSSTGATGALFDVLPQGYQDQFGIGKQVGALQHRAKHDLKILQDKYYEFRPLNPYRRRQWVYQETKLETRYVQVEQLQKYEREQDTTQNDIDYGQDNELQLDTYYDFKHKIQFYEGSSQIREGWAFYQVYYFDVNMTTYIPDTADDRTAYFDVRSIKRYYFKDNE